MIKLIKQEQLHNFALLEHTMFKDRASQLVLRHNWELSIDENGWEMDQYDDENASYLIFELNGIHAASLRIRDMNYPTMIGEKFSFLQPQSFGIDPKSIEVTRLCSSPLLSPKERSAILNRLLLELCRVGVMREATCFYGVVFPAVARIIGHFGWPGEEIAVSGTGIRRLVMMRWLPSHLIFQELDKNSKLHSLNFADEQRDLKDWIYGVESKSAA